MRLMSSLKDLRLGTVKKTIENIDDVIIYTMFRAKEKQKGSAQSGMDTKIEKFMKILFPKLKIRVFQIKN